MLSLKSSGVCYFSLIILKFSITSTLPPDQPYNSFISILWLPFFLIKTIRSKVTNNLQFAKFSGHFTVVSTLPALPERLQKCSNSVHPGSLKHHTLNSYNFSFCFHSSFFVLPQSLNYECFQRPLLVFLFF